MEAIDHFLSTYIRAEDLEKSGVCPATLFHVLDHRISEISLIQCDKPNFPTGCEIWEHVDKMFVLRETFDIIDANEIELATYISHDYEYPIKEYPMSEALRQARRLACKFIEDYARQYSTPYNRNILVQWRDPDYRYVFLCWFDNHGNMMELPPSWFDIEYIRKDCIFICYRHLTAYCINRPLGY